MDNNTIKHVIKALFHQINERYRKDLNLKTPHFHEWFDKVFPYTKINERTELFDLLYNGKGVLWKEKYNPNNEKPLPDKEG